jgi:hypothetical protein
MIENFTTLTEENGLASRYEKKTEEGKKRMKRGRQEEDAEEDFLHVQTAGLSTFSERR